MPTGVYLKTAEHRAKISKTMTGRHRSAKIKAKISKTLTGRKLSAEHRKNISKSHAGSKHPRWKGGKSLVDTPPEITHAYRQAIRRRDNFICAICNLKLNGKHRRFETHHIDDDHKNSHPDNMITLCRNCHRKTMKNTKEPITIFECRRALKKIKYQNPARHKEAVKLYKANMELFYEKEG